MSAAKVFASGNTALITGGASGIGLAISQLCRKHGMKVAVVDNNGENLSKAKSSLDEGNTGDAETYQMDVSKLPEWSTLKSDVTSKFGSVPDLLVLNAGIGARGTWGDNEYFRKIMETNLFGVINGLNTFVPEIEKAGKPSAIVITGSKQGITNPPGSAAYNASKAAVKTLAEHLSFDLRHSKTTVHLLVPGWTFTGLTGNAPGSGKEKPAGAWWPSQVAEYLEKKMGENQFYVICPDNEVSEELDKKRIMYGPSEIVYGKMPLTRWREETKEWAKRQIEGIQLRKDD